MKLRQLAFHPIFRSRRRERLVRNYFFLSVILIAGGLISAGLFEIYFRYMREFGTSWSRATRRCDRRSVTNRTVHSRHRNNDEGGDKER